MEEYLPVSDSIFIDGESSVYTDTISLAPQTYELGFYVVDSDNNQPLSGAFIEVDTASCHTDTDGFGNFWLPRGYYEYSVKADGYQDHQGTQFLTNSVGIDVSLNPMESSVEQGVVKSVQVYPNPFHGMIHIQIPSAPAQMIIYTATGTIVRSMKLRNERERINLKNSRSGMYILKIRLENQVYYKKLLKTE